MSPFETIDWIEVDSSWIDALAYDGLSGYMRTQTGAIYTFPGLTRGIFQEWLAADSKGSYFNDHLKGQWA